MKQKVETPPTFSIYTLGCKVNQYESDAIQERLLSAGFLNAPPGRPADVCIVNTCTVTIEAARKSRQGIRKMINAAPGAKVYAIGCAAEIPKRVLSNVPSQVIMVSNKEKDALADKILSDFGLKCSGRRVTGPAQGRTRAYLKVQDGCDHFCSYCIIPYVRGRSRSRNPVESLEELIRLEDAGYKEAVITGIHLGDYGKGLEKPLRLPELLDYLLENSSIPRVRLSSLEPMDFSFDLLDVFRKHQRLCRHLHLPLQHGSDRILKLMSRNYTLKEYDEIIIRAVGALEGLNVTTDVMAGFPSESTGDFQILYDYVKRAPFFQLHVFPFSRHESVKAAHFEGIVAGDIKKERVKKLIALAKEKHQKRLDGYVGKEAVVLTERETRPDILTGLTGNYARVEYDGPAEYRGKIVKLTVKRRFGEILYGENPKPLHHGG